MTISRDLPRTIPNQKAVFFNTHPNDNLSLSFCKEKEMKETVELLNDLKFFGIKEALMIRAQEAESASLSYQEFLATVLEDERLYRRNRRCEVLRKRAKFRASCYLENFECSPTCVFSANWPPNLTLTGHLLNHRTNRPKQAIRKIPLAQCSSLLRRIDPLVTLFSQRVTL